MDKKSASPSDERQQRDEFPFKSFRETFINAISNFTKTAGQLIEIPEQDLQVDLPLENEDSKDSDGQQDVKSAKTEAVASKRDVKKESEAAALNEIMDFDLAGW